MRHLLSVLLLSGVLAACGSAREEFRAAVKAEVEKAEKAQVEKEQAEEGGTAMTLEDGETVPEEVTNAAGRAYLAKLAATGDAACACKTEECGKSVMDSWMLGVVAGSSSYTLSPADKGREEKALQRLFLCAGTSAPDKRDELARAKAETKAARDKTMAFLADPYEGESDTTRAAFRTLRRDLRELCACTTMACVEALTPRFSNLPVVTLKREVGLLRDVMAGVMACGGYAVANETLAGLE